MQNFLYWNPSVSFFLSLGKKKMKNWWLWNFFLQISISEVLGCKEGCCATPNPKTEMMKAGCGSTTRHYNGPNSFETLLFAPRYWGSLSNAFPFLQRGRMGIPLLSFRSCHCLRFGTTTASGSCHTIFAIDIKLTYSSPSSILRTSLGNRLLQRCSICFWAMLQSLYRCVFYLLRFSISSKDEGCTSNKMKRLHGTQ